MSGKRKNSIDISSCKPCSVVLERLSEGEMRNLSSGDSSGVKNRREDPTERWSSRRCLPLTKDELATWKKRCRTKSRNRNFEESEHDCSKKETGEENLDTSLVHKQPKKLKNRIYTDETSESDSDSLSNNLEERIEEFGNFLREEGLGGDNSTEHQPQRENTGSNISQNKDAEKPDDRGNLSTLQHHKLLLEKKGSGTEAGETGETGDLSCSMSGWTSLDDSKNKLLPPKCFSLSLKQKTTDLGAGESPGKDFQRKISVSKDLCEVPVDGELKITHLEHSLKRKIGSSIDAEPLGSKLRKYERKESYNDKGIDEDRDENNRSEAYPCRDRQVQSNEISGQDLSLKVGNKVPNVKNLRVSLIKLELMGSLAARKQEDNFEPVDRCMNVTEDDHDSRSEIGKARSENMVGNSPTKNRSTKITDYFFKVDKNTFNDNDKKNFSKPNKDFVLKEKYGICKNLVVALVHLEQKKIPVSGCLASENRELTDEPSSFINLNYKSICTYSKVRPSSSSTSPSIKLSSSFEESSTNCEQTPTRVTHPPLVDNHSQKELPVSLSPRSHQSSQTKKPSPTESTEDLPNDNSYVKFRTPRSRREKEASNSAERVEDQEVSEKAARSEKNLSELMTEEQPLLTNANEAGNHLSDLQVDKTTPKSRKIVSSQSKTPALTPGKRLVLTTDDLGMNETRSPGIEIKRESPRIIAVQVKQGTMTQGSSEILPDGNEPQEKPDGTSDLNKDSNTVADQRVSVIRSPVIGGQSLPCAKQKIQRRLPVDSMTFINRDILDDNSSWVGLENTIDFADETNSTTEKNCTLRENVSAEIFANDDTQLVKRGTKSKILGSTSSVLELVSEAPVKNLFAERPVSENIDPCSSGLVQKKIAEIQRSDSASETEASVSTDEHSTYPNNLAEVTEGTSTVIEYLISKAAENVSPLRSTRTNVKHYSSASNILVKETIKKIQPSDAAPGIETSVSTIGIPEPISPAENPSDPISVEGSDQGLANLKSQTHLRTEREGGDLMIDVEERASDEPSATNVVSSDFAAIGKSPPAEAVREARKILTNIKCILCIKTFKNKGNLEKHLQSHVKSIDDCCSICDKPIPNENIIKHYLEHCSSTNSAEEEFFICHICKKKFKKNFNLDRHLRLKHNANPKSRRKVSLSENVNHNKCTVCLLACNSAEDLFTHMQSHIGQELQDAYEVAKAKQQLRHVSTTDCQSEAATSSDTSEKGKTVERERVVLESAEADDTSVDSELSVCTCHKEERLEMSGGVIIEVALACRQCKTFFKTNKCFRDHYSNTSCKWSSNNVVTPKLFCNKCCMILNCLRELHMHLTKHDEVDVEMKTSFLCKRCNMFYFGIGDLFYAHWFEHWNNPLFVADHRSFPNNMRVNIVEPESTEGMTTDEPTQSLFIAEHQCDACQTPFQIEADLKKHLSSSNSCSKKVAEDRKLYYKLVCSMCNKEYTEKSTFDNHIEEHDDIRDFLRGPKGLKTSVDSQLSCSFCKTTYDTVTKYKEHLVRHKIMQEKFFCNYCTLMMDSVEDFEQHCTEHRGTQEKPVACKIVFAKAKFHCEPCIIRFDNQTLLDDHLAIHSNGTTSEPISAEDLTPSIVSVIEKRSPVCTPCRQKCNDEMKVDGNDSPRNGDALGKSVANPVVIDLSDDSNSTDIQIIENVENQRGEKAVVENNSDKEDRKREDRQETEKPVFLRVKNLKELLPFNCKVCKAEFDTPLNLSKHVCTPNVASGQACSQDVIPAKGKDSTYFCTICKKYRCNNDAEWIRHVLSHFPLHSSTAFSDSWFHVSTQPHGQQEFTCKICGLYKSLTIHTMRLHFIAVHPNIYRPLFKCRICHSFETEAENEMRRHEYSHCLQPNSLFLQLINPDNNSSSLQPVEKSNNSRQLVSMPPTTSSPSNSSSLQQVSSTNNSRQPVQVPPASGSGNSSSMFQVMKNFTTPQQPGLTPPASTPGDITSFLQVLRNFTNPQGTLRTSPLNNSENNSSLLQSVQNLNSPQQPVQPSTVPSSGNNSSPLESVEHFNNPQQPVQLSPVTSSGDSPLLQPDKNFNSTQQPRSIPSLISLSNNLQPSQPVDLNNFPQSVLNKVSSVQKSQNLHNSEQPFQPMNNWDKFQQPASVPPVMSSANSLSSYQPMDNSQWLTPTAGTLQIQINNTPSYNNMTLHTVPLYVANVVYCCRICKNFKCSSTQELKAHESLHDGSQMGEPSQKYYRCKVCTNFFCSSEAHLKAHNEIHHTTEQLNGAKNQIQSNPSVTDTQIKCRNCFQVFETSHQLIQHEYTCNKLANRQQNNTQFQHVHPYSCQLCSIVFVNEAFLRDHIRQTHPDVKLPRPKTSDGKNLYQCNTCGLLLISEETLSYHMKSHNIGFQQ